MTRVKFQKFKVKLYRTLLYQNIGFMWLKYISTKKLIYTNVKFCGIVYNFFQLLFHVQQTFNLIMNEKRRQDKLYVVEITWHYFRNPYVYTFLQGLTRAWPAYFYDL